MTRKENGFPDEKDKAFAEKPDTVSVYTADSVHVLYVFHRAASDGDEKQFHGLVRDKPGLQFYRHSKLHTDLWG